MRILALDPSTKAVGWVLLDVSTDCILEYGIHKPAGKTLDAKLHNAHHWLRALFFAMPLPIDVIAIEQAVYHRNVKTLIVLAQMTGALRVAAYPCVARVFEIIPSERRLALGIPLRLKAKPAKDAIRGLVNQIYGLDLGPKDHDISDAIAVALAAAKKLKLEEEQKCP